MSSEMTLTDLKRLAEAATPGKWHISGKGDDAQIVQTNHVTRDVWTIPRTHEDLAFIAACREMVPKLIAVAEAADSLVGELQLADKQPSEYNVWHLLREALAALTSELP